MLSDCSDAKLATGLNRGDYRAYTAIYERYWEVLWNHAFRILGDEDDAKDVVQDVFTMLWTKRTELHLAGHLSAFLYRSLRNRIFNFIDHSKVRSSYMVSLGKFIDAGEYTTDQWVRERELAVLIEERLAELPEKMRKVFEMSRMERLSYREISQRLFISDNTVKKQISKALKILRARPFWFLSVLYLLFFYCLS